MYSAALQLIAGARVPARRVRLINLAGGAPTLGFGPLAGMGDGFQQALRLNRMAMGEGDSLPMAKEFSLNALLLLRAAGQPVTSLDGIFHDRAFRRKCLESAVPAELRAFWERYDALSAERQGPIASSVLNKFPFLGPAQLKKVLGSAHPVDFDRLVNEPGSILLANLAVHEHHTVSRSFEQMLLDSLKQAAFARPHIPESRRNPIRVYADEFAGLSMEGFEQILSEGRKWGIHLVASFQNLAQLNTRLRAVLLGNSGAKMAFCCSRDDAAVLSKDLTGDPKALPLAELPVGEAVLWTRKGGCVSVEVNEPLVRDVGTLGQAARRLVRQVTAEAEAAARADLQSGGETKEGDESVSEPRGHRPGKGSALEDWLCD